MKKVYSIIVFIFIVLCGGCSKFSFNDNRNIKDNNVPTTLINTTISVDDDLSVLYNNCKKAVVTVLNYASYYDRGKVVTSLYGSGSGFVYSYDKDYIYLYTNAHVVDVGTGYTQSYYEVVFYDGYRSYATLAYSDGSEDVAIMKVGRTSQDFSVASLANSDSVIPGSSVFAIGSPLGLEYSNTITRGIVSNVKVAMSTDDDGDGNNTTMYLIQVDSALNPGNSGGPLFNNVGEVIGVNTLKLARDKSGEEVESFNFAIPINHFVMVANSLAETGVYNRPKLGISVIDVEDLSLKEREAYGISVSEGIYIESVANGSVSSGILNVKEIIAKINNVTVGNLADFSCELYKYKKGDKITIATISLSGTKEKSYNIILN